MSNNKPSSVLGESGPNGGIWAKQMGVEHFMMCEDHERLGFPMFASGFHHPLVLAFKNEFAITTTPPDSLDRKRLFPGY